MNDTPHTPSPLNHADERARLRAVTDRELVLALRRDEPLAWSEFADRASRILAATASRLRFSDDERSACGDELLARLAERLGDPSTAVPDHLPGYIASAAIHCRRETVRNLSRAASIRHRAALADTQLDLPEAGQVVASVLSDHTRHVARGAADDTPSARTTISDIVARQLLNELREIDVQLLTWHAASVPHRTIGEWLGLSAATVAKRVQRIQRRARARVLQLVALLPAREQDEWRRQWRSEPRCGAAGTSGISQTTDAQESRKLTTDSRNDATPSE